jgi:hypothetical protein
MVRRVVLTAAERALATHGEGRPQARLSAGLQGRATAAWPPQCRPERRAHANAHGRTPLRSRPERTPPAPLCPELATRAQRSAPAATAHPPRGCPAPSAPSPSPSPSPLALAPSLSPTHPLTPPSPGGGLRQRADAQGPRGGWRRPDHLRRRAGLPARGRHLAGRVPVRAGE